MREDVKNIIRRADKRRKRRKKIYAGLAVCAVLVAGFVSWKLILPGIALGGDTYCGKAEHTHSEACYEDVLACGQEEGAGAHTHTEACYTTVQTDELICGQEESAGHTHSDACYDEEGNLTCGQEESAGHIHTEACYGTEQQLTCGQEESAGHIHSDACYQKQMTCGMEEHTHTLACHSNPNAVESEEEWTAAFKDYQLTGEWGKDAAYIAKTQVGYKESESNYTVNEDETTDGYTRYGAWNNDPYGDWDLDFAAFVLSYAGVPDEQFPINANGLNEWTTQIQNAGYYVAPDGAAPESGDLVVLEKDGQDRAQQMGIVSEVRTDKDGNVTEVKVIEGNCDREVKENTYKADDEHIIAYGLVSSAYAAYSDKEEEEPDEDTETVQKAEAETYQTEQPATKTPAANSPDSKNTLDADGGQVDQRVTVSTTVDGNAQAPAGQRLKVDINATYSGANQETKAEIWIRLDGLTDDLSLVGFSADGKHTVVTTQKKEIVVELVKENGVSYIHFPLEQGDTAQFNLDIDSENGVMPQTTTVTVEADKEKTTIAGDKWGVNDQASAGATLTWTADFQWDDVVKKVNGVDENIITVNAQENRLSGELIYTIDAIGHNQDTEGAIWTDRIEITDTVTLADGQMWFPDDARFDATSGKILTGDGKDLVWFNNGLQGGTVTEFDWVTEGGRRTGFTYTISVPNQNLGGSGTVQEQTNLDLEMRMDAKYLALTDNFWESCGSGDVIQNKVDFTAHAYKDHAEPISSSDQVKTTPVLSPDKGELVKTADRESAKAGDAITYTIKFTNIGDHPIEVVKEDGSYYAVTDTLPVHLELTKEQIQALEEKGASYDEATRTITWIPSTKPIGVNEGFILEFSATVKDADDPDMAGMGDGSSITNSVSYKDFTTTNTVEYGKAKITVEKKDANYNPTYHNGDEITYRIKVKNEGKADATENSTFTDTLPEGLIFQYAMAQHSNQDHWTENVTKEVQSENGNDYTVVFKVDGKKLSWEIDPLKAGDTLILYYVCKINTDEATSTTLRNTITGDDGQKDYEDIGIEQPLKLFKSVEQDTNVVYPDETIFDYRISISNDQNNPSTKDDYELVDILPEGMLPYGCILTEGEGGSTVAWADFAANPVKPDVEYRTTINGDTVYVTKQGNKIVLTWKIGKIVPGAIVTKTYRAQIHLRDDQKGGQAIAYTNIVKLGNLNKQVTVYGGEGAKLAIGKNIYVREDNWDQFIARWRDPDYPDSADQMKKVAFEITGKDEEGNPITFEDGTTTYRLEINADNYPNEENHYFEIPETLEPGTYTIKEVTGDVDGYHLFDTDYKVNNGNIQDYTADKGIQVTVANGRSAKVLVNNRYRKSADGAVDIQKSVWGMAKVALYNNYPTFSDKEILPISPGSTDRYLVAYNISVVNTGTGDITIHEITDQLPEGVSFVGLWASNANAFRNGSSQKLDEIQFYGNGEQALIEYTDGDQSAAFIRKTSDGTTGELTFSVKDRNEQEKLTLTGGQVVTFLVICEVDANVQEDIPLTNTATVKVDSDVEYLDAPEIKMKNTPYDYNQNNGSSQDEGVTDGYRYVSSSVDITPKKAAIPGITKKAVSYFNYTETVDHAVAVPDTNIIDRSDSIIKWEITLYNDGAVDLEDYLVEDAVTDPFRLITEEQAAKAGISQRATLQKWKFNGGDVGEPVTDGNLLDVSDKYKEVEGEDGKSTYQFELKDKDYAIQPGGYAVLTIYTYYDKTNYQTYVNTATLSPQQEFDAHGVKDGRGELVKDENGAFTGVTTSAYVFATGGYGSISVKEIEEKDDPTNKASGTPAAGEKNYITVSSAEETVTYTNRVMNISDKAYSDLVIIDRLPALNDRGVVNWQDQRGSEFKVSYLENTLELTVVQSNGTAGTLSEEDYTVQFSALPADTAYQEEDFNNQGAGSGWHDTWQEGDTSFRIVMADDFQLEGQEMLQIRYDGDIEDSAAPGQIAWNSFGYRYTAEGTTLTAEPPKVGVMIPSDAIIRKEVVNGQGEVQEANPYVSFTFRLYKGEGTSGDLLAEFKVSQGGYVKLSEIQDTKGEPLKLESGQTYTLEEVLAEGSAYKLLGIAKEGETRQEGPYTFAYNGSVNLTIIARNQLGEYELPETGGPGTIGFLAGGAILMAFSCLAGGYRMRRRRERRGRA